MATLADTQAVKSLNISAGRRRFAFKTFYQRLDDIEIDVYRSLDKIKSEPSDGSSFFRDCLVDWRELNTGEDFISFYEEMTPFVQTLPLVLFHKDTIMSELLFRLQMKARISLEPILRLIAALCRDLVEEDIMLFLPKVTKSLVSLLVSGADREPEIIEQIFTSWSYIMMYLQRFLVNNIVDVLKVTRKLRYYPKYYIQDFMAEALSFLLRNAPFDQLKQGVQKIMFEVAKKPQTRKYGVSALLFYVMKGSSTRLHSKVERVLQFLMSNPMFFIGDKLNRDFDEDPVIEVLILTFQRLFEVIEPKDLNLMWRCLHMEINDSVKNKSFTRLSRLLSLLISTVQIIGGRRVFDCPTMLDIVALVLQTFTVSSSTAMAEDHLHEVFDKVRKLMICIIDVLHIDNDMSEISKCSLKWAQLFELRSCGYDQSNKEKSSLLTFIQELLSKDPSILKFFSVDILRSVNDLIENSREETSQEEAINLLLCFLERHHMEGRSFYLDVISEKGLQKIQDFLQSRMLEINDIVPDDSLSTPILKTNLALLWGSINCAPYFFDFGVASSLLINVIEKLDHFLIVEPGNVAGIPRDSWQSIISAAISSISKLHYGNSRRFEETKIFLQLAKRHNSCLQVLSAVADFLDSAYGQIGEADCNARTYHPELKEEKIMGALSLFSNNLHDSEKQLRVATLRILCHYEPLVWDVSADDQPPQKKMKTESSQNRHTDGRTVNVLQLLLSIETTPFSVSTSRMITLLISRVNMAVSVGRIPEAYVPLIMNGMIGVFHNRFSYFWHPASECLAALVNQHIGLVWDKFMSYFEQILSTFQAPNFLLDEMNAKSSDELSDLIRRFKSSVTSSSDSTPTTTVLSLLIQSLQRIPAIVEARSRCIVPLFLRFLGYSCDDIVSVESFNAHVCKGKEWKSILKEWLNLLKLMRNLRSFYQNQFLKDVLQIRLLDENDPEIQMKVLDCLLIWKDDFLLPYGHHLKKLLSSDFREALTTWSLSKESRLIEQHHRAYVVPLVVRLLMPKVRKLKKHATRMQASVNSRKAVLGFIAHLEVDELPLFFASLIKPLQIIPVGIDVTFDQFWTLCRGGSVNSFQASNFLEHFTVDNIRELSWKKRYGFLHVIEDVIGVFDESRGRPFLDLLMGCVVRILKSCTCSHDAVKGNSSLDDDQYESQLAMLDTGGADGDVIPTGSALKKMKELRSLCLKIVSLVLNKYEDNELGYEFWDIFFTSVKPLVSNFRQEGSSAEKPSSLFSCFVAMSRSQKLVPLLLREKNLVPDIFSILTVTSASEAVLHCVLKFTENLLNLDSEFEIIESDLKRVLLSNLEPLICSLHYFFQRDSATKRKMIKCPGETEIRIFKLLLKYIRDPLLARKFVDMLLPFLARGAQNSDNLVEAVRVIQGTVPILKSQITKKILNAVSPLFISIDRDMRSCLCDLLETLAQEDSSISNLAKLVHDLNATSAVEVGGLDYDVIVSTYEKINIDFFYTVDVDKALVILSHCVYDMSSEELILRHSAYRLLLLFVQFTKLVLEEVHTSLEMPRKMTTTDYGNWTKGSVKRMISKFFLKHLGNAMKEEASVRKEWIKLLREMVLTIPNVANLNSLKPLSDEKDTEVDFFNNIIHLQKHRRARALSRFTDKVDSSFMLEGITNKVFVPLFFNMLFEAREGKDESLGNACVQALASISGHMEWDSYYSLLMTCFKKININQDMQKIFLRLICSILDQFHFSDANGTKTSGSLVTLRKCGNSSMESDIQACLRKAMLPKIQKLLDSDSDKVNVNISLAALKVLKLLPGDIMNSQLPSIIHRVSKFLKNRMESIRDEARSALAACLKELGLEYLQFIVRILQTTLKRGYELHVLGYSLNFILSKTLTAPVSGKMDYCLEELLSVVETDILGEVAEEKEVEKIALKIKETKKRKSFETLKLIAQSVTFKSHALKVLSPVTSQLQKHLTPKLKSKLESMLNHIAAGFECNPTVVEADLYIFIYQLIAKWVEGNQSKVGCLPTAEEEGNNSVDGNITSTVQVKSAKLPSSHLTTVFALGMLHKRVMNVRSGENDVQLLSRLDPFVPLLANCLNRKYEDVLSASLRCLAPLVRLPLPSIASEGDKMKGVVFDIVQSTGNTRSRLMMSSLKLLTALLWGHRVTLSSKELHSLIQLPVFVDLEKDPSKVALSLLKAIVCRKLVVPEIYDLSTRVSKLMVTSQVESVRKKCDEILLRFLLDYQLTGQRLQQHLDSLVSDLSYHHPSGRKAVLEMLRAIIEKFPKTVVDYQSQTLFIHLSVCLTNDQDKDVRLMTGTVIKLLISRITTRSVHLSIDRCISWYMGENPQLWSAAAQVLALLAEAVEGGFARQIINSVLPRVKSIFESAISRSRYYSDEDSPPFWKEAYYSMVMLEKMLRKFDGLWLQGDLEDIWVAICELLSHPHIWVRDVSSRLIRFYFDAVEKRGRGNHYLLTNPNRLFLIVASLCDRLKTEIIGNAARDTIKQNLVFAIHRVHSFRGRDPQEFWATLQQREQDRFIQSLKLLDSEGLPIFLSIASGNFDENGGRRNEDIWRMLVSSMLKKMGKIALQMEDVQMKIVFSSFAEIISKIDNENRLLYAREVLLPLYKVHEGFAGKVISDDAKQFAQEMWDGLEKLLDSQSFSQVYNEIRRSLKSKRDKRKREEKLMAVVNPMRNAKRKLRIAAKHRAHKKRKIMAMKLRRRI